MSIVLNQFTQYNLNENELLSGSVLTALQKQVIQNRLAECSHEKLSSIYASADHMKCIQQEAELHGKIGMLRYLLDMSDAAEVTLIEIAQSSSN